MPDPGRAVRWSGSYLAVDGAPFLVVGAEVHNSSSSTEHAIAESFAAVAALGANTVLAPVAWDLFEPVEGEFDYRLVDAMIGTAREHGMRLIPLWFASWKNGVSSYAPWWVKSDPERFPLAVLSDGAHAEHLSPFVAASRDADARAFAQLMRHIRDVDDDGTVIAVQVENEIGLLGDSRDRSRWADEAFAARVPHTVVDAIANEPTMPVHEIWLQAGARREGSWTDVFGSHERVDEAFMAAAFASYVGAVAAAGAAEHDVPLFVNAWLDADSVLDGPVALAGGKRPGDYPSGGPVMPVAAIWEALAPDLDFLAPDLYVDDAEPHFAAYRARRGRLFTPELRADATGIGQLFSAIGTHRALGASPFGVDSLEPDSPDAVQLADAYRLLRAAGALIRSRPDAMTYGFHLTAENPSVVLEFDCGTFQIHTQDEWGYITPVYPGYGLAIDDGDGIFLIGRGFWVTPVAAEGQQLTFCAADHYRLDGDELTVVRRLNGDERGGLVPFPFLDMPLVPGRVIPTRIPDAGIARLAAYSY